MARASESASGPHWFDAWTRDLARDVTAEDLQRLFTRDTREAYRFFSRGLDEDRLAREPWWTRLLLRVRQVFVAFTLKLSPARRALYLVALFVAILGVLKLYRGWATVSVPFGTPFFNVAMFAPQWANGTFALLVSFILVNLLLLVEVADRLSLKGELEVAREIQLAMLPTGTYSAGDADICGVTRPANTVGGDFYDVLPLRRRPGDHHDWRRGRQRQPRCPADGVAARRAAHARGRKPRALRARCALEHADLPAQPRIAVHHVVLRGLHPGDRRAHLRERRAESAAASTHRRHNRAARRHRHRARDVRRIDVRGGRDTSCARATSWCSTATA